jgi:hypothetical protein
MDHLNHIDLAGQDGALKRRAREPNPVRVREGLHVLWRSDNR